MRGWTLETRKLNLKVEGERRSYVTCTRLEREGSTNDAKGLERRQHQQLGNVRLVQVFRISKS